MSLHDLHTLPGVTAQPDAATAHFVFNHTMLRVKDIEKSLDFYTRVLGFRVVDKRDFPEAAFSLYFLALVDPAQIPADDAARHQWMKSIPGVLELTHNHGTENDAGFAYHNGNTDRAGLATSAFRCRTCAPPVRALKHWMCRSRNACRTGA